MTGDLLAMLDDPRRRFAAPPSTPWLATDARRPACGRTTPNCSGCDHPPRRRPESLRAGNGGRGGGRRGAPLAAGRSGARQGRRSRRQPGGGGVGKSVSAPLRRSRVGRARSTRLPKWVRHEKFSREAALSAAELGGSVNKLRVAGIGFALAIGALASTPATAAQVYDWTFTNTSNVVEASGTLTASTPDNGGFDVTALHGFVNDPTVGVDGPITSFTPGPGDDGIFAWDNVVYTSTPHLDNLGLLFDAGGQEVNIYNATGACCSIIYPGVFPNGDITAGSSNNYGGDAGTFNMTAVPEPATWALMLFGVGMVGAGLRMARRNNPVALTAA